MSVIRDGLEKKLNVSLYADPSYTYEQMRAVLLSLEIGERYPRLLSDDFSKDRLENVISSMENLLSVIDTDNDEDDDYYY